MQLLFSICLGVRLCLIIYVSPLANLKAFTSNFSDKGNGRLGHSNFPNSRGGVPFPTQVRLPSVQVVSLVAGGMYVSLYLSLSRESQLVIQGHSMLWTQMATFMSGVCASHVSASHVIN